MKKILVCFLAALILAAITCTVQADGITTVQIEPLFGQTEARTMLSMINAFRTGGDAWYWNSDDTTKTMCGKLSALTYDYGLERVAMQRAAEIALSYSHTRPNNTSCFSAYTYSYWSAGENIAAGYYSAEDVYVGWREDDLPYSGQGHRRNMLNPRFTAVGFGHVYYNGYHYWVQEFTGGGSSGMSVTAAEDGRLLYTIEVSNDLVMRVSSLSTSENSLDIAVSAQVSAPVITAQFRTNDTWPSYTSATPLVSWTSSNTAVVEVVNGNRIRGKAAGQANITATVFGNQVTVPVRVGGSGPTPVPENPGSVKEGTTSIKVDAGKTVKVKFTASRSGQYTFQTLDDQDTYGSLYDNGSTLITNNDDGGEGYNFRITSWMAKGQSVYIALRYYDSSYSGNQTLSVSRAAAKEFMLPSRVTQVKAEAFLGDHAEVVVLPSTCKSIGSKAFANNTNLHIILIPSSVTSIAADAFSGSGSVVICGIRGSTAEAFANREGISFIEK